ncbi:MAG: glycosyltransferase family 9 protein [Gemmatimonadetes bacterium]|nr:glycosyltransferase family 9 protein [Gemmatimonadota bacterium]MDE3257475.1 glycosyltransferase family 9 protein [Gemmatimonadota bacterium]
MPVNPKQISIIRSGAIGDFVLTLPVVNALRAAYPRSCLRLIGNPSILRLAPVSDLVDINSAEVAGLYNPVGTVPERTRALFSDVDLLIAYAVDPDRSLQSRLANIVRGRAIVYDPRPKAGVRIVEHLLTPLRRMGIPTSDPIPRIRPAVDEMAHAGEILKKHGLASPLIAIHPGSGGREKCWPLTSYLELAHRLATRGAGVMAVCGPVERNVADKLPAHLPCLAPRDLRSLAALLHGVDLFIGNDSGPGHIAAAVGTPTLTLFGPTDAVTWAPRHPHARILRAPDGRLPALSVESVLNAALKLLAAVPPPPDSHRN